jgi:hypothetical protein
LKSFFGFALFVFDCGVDETQAQAESRQSSSIEEGISMEVALIIVL